MKVGNGFPAGADHASLEPKTKRFNEPSILSSFSNDLISLSAGVGVVLREITANSEVREGRIEELRSQYASGAATGNSGAIAAAMLFRGFDSLSAQHAPKVS